MGTRSRLNRILPLISFAAVVIVLLGWQLASANASPTLFPTPLSVAQATVENISNGSLADNIGISLQRVFLGWALGCVVAIPIGILAGSSTIARAAMDPFIHFFRFVPALALVSLFMLWFGIGEESKINLIAWAVGFTVVVTTASGASGVPQDKIDAARCFGASRFQVLSQVIIPAAVPSIFTGMRLALSTAFLVVVAAEALAARSGIGFLIYNARTYFRTDEIFLGVLCFGILGFLSDRAWKIVGATALKRFLRGTGNY